MLVVVDVVVEVEEVVLEVVVLELVLVLELDELVVVEEDDVVEVLDEVDELEVVVEDELEDEEELDEVVVVDEEPPVWDVSLKLVPSLESAEGTASVVPLLDTIVMTWTELPNRPIGCVTPETVAKSVEATPV